jgi:hypothetical protein
MFTKLFEDGAATRCDDADLIAAIARRLPPVTSLLPGTGSWRSAVDRTGEEGLERTPRSPGARKDPCRAGEATDAEVPKDEEVTAEAVIAPGAESKSRVTSVDRSEGDDISDI